MSTYFEHSGKYKVLDLVEWEEQNVEDTAEIKQALLCHQKGEQEMRDLAEAAAGLAYLLKHRPSDLRCLVTRTDGAYMEQYLGFGGREVHISDTSAGHHMFRRLEIQIMRREAEKLSLPEQL